MPAQERTKTTARVIPYTIVKPPAVSPKLANATLLSSQIELLGEDAGLPYPTTPSARSAFVLPGGKKVSAHQWKVYDLILNIPVGKITTYKHVASTLGSASQAVGGALRHNPFAPYVPCHRIVSSDLKIGGFMGESNKKGGGTGSKVERKRRLLEGEGVEFDGEGRVVGGEGKVWKGKGSAR